MRIIVLLAALVMGGGGAGGCSFEGAEGTPVVSDDDDGTEPAPPDDVDDPQAISPFCADPTIRLCLELDDSLEDGTVFGQDVFVDHVAALWRDGRGALGVSPGTEFQIAPSPTLDVRGPLTIELWAALALPPIGRDRSTLIDADEQFALSIKADGNVECEVGDKKVGAGAGTVTEVSWHHFACTWDGTALTLYVDGTAKKRSVQPSLAFDHEPIGAIEVGARREDDVRTDVMTGAVDDLRVFSRALGADEICAVGC